MVVSFRILFQGGCSGEYRGIYVYSIYLLLAFLIYLLYSTLPVHSSSFEVDVTAFVYRVVDGDTFDAFPVGRVRLADVDAPEIGEAGYIEAVNALRSLVLDRKVYLDVDDLYVMDRYNRIICVVYVRHNSTHLMNVNYWLIANGYVKISDYVNEFNPYAWSLYVYYPVEWETTTTVTVTRVLGTTTTATVTKPTTITATLTKTMTQQTTLTTTLTQTTTLTTTRVKVETTTIYKEAPIDITPYLTVIIALIAIIVVLATLLIRR